MSRSRRILTAAIGASTTFFIKKTCPNLTTRTNLASVFNKPTLNHQPIRNSHIFTMIGDWLTNQSNHWEISKQLNEAEEMLKIDEPKEALDSFQHCISQIEKKFGPNYNSHLARALNGRAFCHLKLGIPKDVGDDLLRAMKLDPDNAFVQKNLKAEPQSNKSFRL